MVESTCGVQTSGCRATVIRSGAVPALVGMLGSGAELPLSIYVLHALQSILSSDSSGTP